jgi:hypothetical protein
MVNLIYKDSSSMILKNILFVSKVGANLLSARYLYKVGLVGYFNSENIYFKLNRKIIIKVMIDNSCYIKNHISSHHRETIFHSIDHR